MSISAVAPTPFPQDPDRLEIPMPRSRAEDGSEAKSADTGSEKHLSMFADGDDSPSFWDFLDIINPLQHIPIVNNLYQELTGDKIGVGARLVGGTLFGGPLGLIASAADCVVEESTGKDSGGHVLALFRDDSAPASDTMVASADAKPDQGEAKAQATPAAPAIPAAQAEPPPAAAAPQAPVQAQKLADMAAPVITLPEDGGKVAAKGAMTFSLDGGQSSVSQANSAVAQAASASPTSTTATAATAQLVAAAQAPMPLTAQSAKFRPVPARTSVDPKNAPMLTVPVSTSQTNSIVPITGRAPASAVPVAAKKAEVPATHPMLPPTDANGQTATSSDWFTSAWSEALDKYQQANRRNDAVTGGASLN